MKNQNEKIVATANNSKRTFTLRHYVNGEIFAKYRTFPTDQEDFDDDWYNTNNDWKYFLRSGSYYLVKKHNI